MQLPQWMTQPWEVEVKGAWWKVLAAGVLSYIACIVGVTVVALLEILPQIASESFGGEVTANAVSMNDVIVAGVIATGVFFLFSKVFKIRWFDFKKVTLRGVLKIFGVYIGYIGVSSIVSIVITMLAPDVQTTVNQEMLMNVFEGVSPIVVVMLVTVLAPIGEEIFFRGMIMKYWLGKYPIVGATVSWAWFMMGHVHQSSRWTDYVVYGLMSAVLVGIYLRTRRLEYAILFHMINNFVAAMMMI